MNKPLPERMTYAQQKLINWLENRQLRSWCLERNVSHPLIYRIAIGERLPTYMLVSKLIDEIPPAEWIFYTDEKIPFEVKPLPKWDSTKLCKYVLEHKFDYKKISERFEINLESCRNLFVNHRSKPSLMIIRKCALGGVDPAEFFVEGEGTRFFCPERGDIVELSGKRYIVLSRNSYNKEINGFFGTEISKNKSEGDVSVSGLKRICSFPELKTVKYSRIQPKRIMHLDDNGIQKILDSVRKILE